MSTHNDPPRWTATSLALSFMMGVASLSYGDTLSLKQHLFYDQGTASAVPSHTVLAPVDWQVEGKAYWANPKYFNSVPSQKITLKSPEGIEIKIGPVLCANDCRLSRSAVQQGYYRLPEFEAKSGRIVIYRPENKAEWKRFYLDKIVPSFGDDVTDVQVHEIFEIPELTEVLQRQQAPLSQQLQQNNRLFLGLNYQQSCDTAAWGIRADYKQAGVKKDSLLILGIASVYTDSDIGRLIDWDVVVDWNFTGPAGKLENQLTTLTAIAGSVREVPQWTQLKNEHLAQMNRIATQGFMERSRINRETQAELNRIHQETYRMTSAANDRRHQQFIRSIREVEVYGQGNYQYELPAGYNHVYGDGYGNFIMSNDSLFNPNVDWNSSRQWSLLEPNR